MKKTYKSKLHGFNFYVKIGDKLTNVEFEKSFIGLGSVIGCSFSTEDKEMQKAIEANSGFGSVFWTNDVEEPAVEEEADKEEPKKVKRYKETNKE